MKDINNYILEKLKINKDSKVTPLYKSGDVFLSIHKSVNNGEAFIHFEDIVKLYKFNEDNDTLELKFIESSQPSVWTSKYILKNNYIILYFQDSDPEDLRKAKDLALLMPKKEALDILKSLKNNTTKYFDWGHYILGEKRISIITDEDNNGKYIANSTIDKLIEDLNDTN